MHLKAFGFLQAAHKAALSFPSLFTKHCHSQNKWSAHRKPSKPTLQRVLFIQKLQPNKLRVTSQSSPLQINHGNNQISESYDFEINGGESIFSPQKTEPNEQPNQWWANSK